MLIGFLWSTGTNSRPTKCYCVYDKVLELIPDTRQEEMLKYYCYISKSKVDDLFAQTPKGNVEESDTTKTVGLDLSAGTSKEGVSLLSLIGADLSFGANGTIQYNKTEKMQYAKKLKIILKTLEYRKQIQPLTKESISERFDKLYYSITTRFHVSDESSVFQEGGYVDGIVKLESDDIYDSGKKIVLACSMKYFSDTRSNGKYMIHSKNYFFFKEKIPVEFFTVFVFNGCSTDNKRIFGSPLFLIMNEKGIDARI